MLSFNDFLSEFLYSFCCQGLFPGMRIQIMDVSSFPKFLFVRIPLIEISIDNNFVTTTCHVPCPSSIIYVIFRTLFSHAFTENNPSQSDVVNMVVLFTNWNILLKACHFTVLFLFFNIF
jgi:hypothetical protein